MKINFNLVEARMKKKKADPEVETEMENEDDEEETTTRRSSGQRFMKKYEAYESENGVDLFKENTLANVLSSPVSRQRFLKGAVSEMRNILISGQKKTPKEVGGNGTVSGRGVSPTVRLSGAKRVRSQGDDTKGKTGNPSPNEKSGTPGSEISKSMKAKSAARIKTAKG